MFFATIGLAGCCSYTTGASTPGSGQYYCCDGLCFYWNPVYYSPSGAVNTPNACCCCNCCDGGCPVITGDTCECTGAGAEAGEGCIYAVLIIVLILAIFGLLIFIVVGCKVFNDTITRHIHVLKKWTLTQEYVVADLDSPADMSRVLDSEDSGMLASYQGYIQPSAPPAMRQR